MNSATKYKDHLGNAYPSAKARAGAYGLSPDIVYHRLKAGWNLGKALTTETGTEHGGQSKPCKDHLGNEYPSQKAMCESYGVLQSVFCNRLRNGASLKEALSKKKTVTDHLGNEFPNLKSKCRFYNIWPSTYRQRIAAGFSEKEALCGEDKSQKWTDLQGNGFETLQELLEHLGIKPGFYFNRKNRGYSLEEIIAENNSMHPKDHRGSTFNSRKDMCTHWGIPLNSYNTRINAGWSIEEALTKPITRAGGHKRFGWKGPVKDHLGNIFPSTAAMCLEYGIHPTTLGTRIRHGMTLKEALTTPVKSTHRAKGPATDHHGNIFSSEAAMCRAYEIHPTTYTNRIKAGMTKEEALTTPVKKPWREQNYYKSNTMPENNKIIPVDVLPKTEVRDHLGNSYESETAMCRAWGISKSCYNSRKRKGWTTKEILTTPVKEHKKILFYNDRTYTQSELAKTLGVTQAFISKCLIKGLSIDDMITRHEEHFKKQWDPINKGYYPLKQIARNHNIKYTTLLRRLDHGWSIEQALTEDLHGQKWEAIDHYGKEYASLQAMCKAYDIPVQTYKSRIKEGLTVEEALTKPVKGSRCASFKTKYLFQIDNVKYFGATCKICNIERVMTREEMQEHQEQYHHKMQDKTV